MQKLYCGTSNANNGQGHFLGRLNGDKLEIWCAGCKAFHAVTIVDLVRGVVLEYQNNGHDKEQDKRLLW